MLSFHCIFTQYKFSHKRNFPLKLSICDSLKLNAYIYSHIYITREKIYKNKQNLYVSAALTHRASRVLYYVMLFWHGNNIKLVQHLHSILSFACCKFSASSKNIGKLNVVVHFTSHSIPLHPHNNVAVYADGTH